MFGSNTNLNKTSSSGRNPGEPHPDWAENSRYLQRVMASEKVRDALNARKISCKWDGVNKNSQGEFDILTHLTMSWTKDNIPHGYVLNLHRSAQEFREDVDKTFKNVVS